MIIQTTHQQLANQEKAMSDLMPSLLDSFKTALMEQDAKLTFSMNLKGEDLKEQVKKQLQCATDVLKSCHKTSAHSATLIHQLDGLCVQRQAELVSLFFLLLINYSINLLTLLLSPFPL